MASVLCDIVKNSISSLLVLQPLSDEDTGTGSVKLAGALHAVAVTHPVLEGTVINFTVGVPAEVTTI